MRGLVFLLLLLSLPARADLAVLRPHAVVEDAVIRLSDLFDGAGQNAGRVVGPAPAPGRRVVVEPAQLLAIARAHRVAWRPLTSADAVVVERPGRAVPRDEVLDLLRAELVRMGLDGQAELELPGFQAPMVPLAAFTQIALEQPSFEVASNRFSATLVVVAEGMPVLRQRLTGRAVATAAVVVAARRLALGDVVGPDDLRPVRMRVERVRPGLASDPGQVVGRALRRPVAEGAGFAVADLALPQVIAKNAMVTLVMEGPGMSMTAQGRAMAAAARGEVVPVMNLASRAVVEGEVIGPGRVRVAFGSSPVVR
ncbi:flagellar basal body P-ring formation protein FlgA [Roseomonas sp. SSH11]|uniref:Flagellar basal body P-ring formation protein FlgA n=1 Tax=Pararoseomonas baculiformis TaxID=2820812 RepID=A0ABS4AGU4_9PROT|nr:flagellar basal body P-ring formation chaperone FlgA [Pararoseomonas baculiformis]MBP0446250.1 flagellar basal body P-ring formation protein FlgA [Pararoseomonas baculiformis]